MHLTRDAMLAQAEAPAPPNHPHLDSCARCRREVEALRHVLRRIADEDVPEPSPLFWDHFSQRVRAAVADEAMTPSPSWWSGWRSWTYAAGACAVMALVVAVAWPDRPVTPAGTATSAVEVVEAVAADVELPEDEDWEVVIGVAAAEVDAGSDLGEYLAPASAELAVQDLSGDERTALASLLRAELDGHSAEPGL